MDVEKSEGFYNDFASSFVRLFDESISFDEYKTISQGPFIMLEENVDFPLRHMSLSLVLVFFGDEPLLCLRQNLNVDWLFSPVPIMGTEGAEHGKFKKQVT